MASVARLAAMRSILLCAGLLCPPAAFAANAAAPGEDAAAAEAPALDVTVESTFYTDYMDSGLTESDHHPSVEGRIALSYGIFYASVAGYTLDYGTDDPWASVTYTAGITPSFGDLSFDINLARRIKYDDPSSDRWLPYATGTYTFSDELQASLGAATTPMTTPAPRTSPRSTPRPPTRTRPGRS